MSTEILRVNNVALQMFEICLNREEYFPGEVVTGKLLLVTSRAFKTQGIYVKFEGKGSVRWKKHSAHLCGLKEAEFVRETRKYFSSVFRYDFDILQEGCSVLTFEFELPTGIPPSIEAGTIMKQLKILYSLEAMVRTPSEDYRQQKNFTVKGILNLNACPELSRPICKTIRETVFKSCWSSSNRVIVMSFSIKKQGFVPGEQVKAELTIKEGYADTPPLEVEVYLIQEIDLEIRNASRIRRRIVAKSDMVHVITISRKADSQKQTQTKNNFQRKPSFTLKIPDDILISYGNTHKPGQDFIKIRYFIRMSMDQTSFPYRPLQIQLPIKIGTIFIKEQKAGAPILLLAPVALALPRPANVEHKVGINECKRTEKEKQCEGPDPGLLLAVPTKNSSSVVVPQIVVNPNTSLELLPTGLSCRASPKTPKKKLKSRNSQSVEDSSGSLCKTQEAFQECDSDSESFRSGVEELYPHEHLYNN